MKLNNKEKNLKRWQEGNYTYGSMVTKIPVDFSLATMQTIWLGSTIFKKLKEK